MFDYDFSGWATRNDLRCADGRTIRRNAFKDNDGQVVPLVWNHQHNDASNVLGHALLENRDEGVYTYCKFNDTDSGRNAKELVNHGDVVSLSIYANRLKQDGGNVLHGAIREVSLVLAGANPGAFIDSVISHGEESDEEAIIYTDEGIYISHSDEGEEEEMANYEETVQDILDTMDEKQLKVLYALVGQAAMDAQEEAAEHSGIYFDEDGLMHSDIDEDTTVGEIFDTLTEEQKAAVYAIVAEAEADVDDYDEGDYDDMKHNVFESDYEDQGNVLSHSDMEEIVADAKRFGSMKEAVLQHGITDIAYLFPDAQNVSATPDWVKRDDAWVAAVMNGTKHTPFSRIKSMYANITEDEARAKGYIKGKEKAEEVFPVFKRTTTPQTIYKKQKLERDDVIDITDFDVVAWIKTEMRGMLDEELARAILVGDGRNASSDDKIQPTNIRPIWTDDSHYTVNKVFEVSSTMTDDQKAKAFIRNAVKSRKEYKGTGNPVLFTTEDMLTDMLLIEDTNGRVIYETVDKLCNALRVSKIYTVPVMENKTRTVSGATHTLLGIIVNLNDYVVGADKGGAVNMFDDFDIDYNAQKYLIETRCSGALVKPYSAIAIESKPAATSGT